MKVLITGGAGLVGYECARLFSTRGWTVSVVDNNTRKKIFGAEADTSSNLEALRDQYGVEIHDMDIRDLGILPLVKSADAVIHAAAQPSHPKSIDIPMEDFQINAFGTLYLLDLLRTHNREAAFVYCSTNKVYGDTPNNFSYKKVEKRFEPTDPALWDGFDTNLRIDQTMHTPFGVSKAAADLYTQEYSRLYGLKGGVFRMGCITGAAAKAVEMHNWEPYFVRKALTGEKLTIYGHGGFQVRDVIHAGDLAKLFFEFISHPRPGQVYNVGGSRQNSISLLEAIDLIERITGKRINYVNGPERDADHIWWITNLDKARSHYPNWNLKFGLSEIFSEIYERLVQR